MPLSAVFRVQIKYVRQIKKFRRNKRRQRIKGSKTDSKKSLAR